MKYTQWLTYLICVLAAVAASGGLLIATLYRDNEFFKTAWQGNDLVTLLLLPVVLISNHQMRRGSDRAYLVWLGLMSFMFYNYAFYLFGATFNKFFLLYALLFTLSLYSIIIGLIQINAKEIGQSFHKEPPQKLISIFLTTIALVLALVEISQCINFIFNGKEPEVPVLIFALDLSIVVPTTLLAAVLLWKNNAWGKILGAMMLVKSFTYGLVLISGSMLIAVRGLGALDPLFPFYAFVTAGGLVFGWMLLKPLKNKQNNLIPTI